MSDYIEDIELDVMEEEDVEDEDKDEMVSEETAVLSCPNCGEVSADEVLFWCNTCDRKEMVEKKGVWMCPACLDKVGGMECRKCKSRDVQIGE